MEEGLISAWNEEFKKTSFLILPPNILKPISITTIDEGDETFDTKDKVHVITYRLND